MEVSRDDAVTGDLVQHCLSSTKMPSFGLCQPDIPFSSFNSHYRLSSLTIGYTCVRERQYLQPGWRKRTENRIVQQAPCRVTLLLRHYPLLHFQLLFQPLFSLWGLRKRDLHEELLIEAGSGPKDWRCRYHGRGDVQVGAQTCPRHRLRPRPASRRMSETRLGQARYSSDGKNSHEKTRLLLPLARLGPEIRSSEHPTVSSRASTATLPDELFLEYRARSLAEPRRRATRVCGVCIPWFRSVVSRIGPGCCMCEPAFKAGKQPETQVQDEWFCFLPLGRSGCGGVGVAAA